MKSAGCFLVLLLLTKTVLPAQEPAVRILPAVPIASNGDPGRLLSATTDRPVLQATLIHDPRASFDANQRQIVRAAAGLAAQAASFEEKQTLYHRLKALPLPRLVRVGGDPEFFTPSYLRPNY